MKLKQRLKWRAVLCVKTGVLWLFYNADVSTFCKISTAFGDCECNRNTADEPILKMDTRTRWIALKRLQRTRNTYKYSLLCPHKSPLRGVFWGGGGDESDHFIGPRVTYTVKMIKIPVKRALCFKRNIPRLVDADIKIVLHPRANEMYLCLLILQICIYANALFKFNSILLCDFLRWARHQVVLPARR